MDAELTGVTPYNVTGLATAMPPEEARAALLGSLDSGRPYAAAATLTEQYIDDDHVRAALASRRRGDYAHAAPMAGVAIDVLGPGEGFAVLVSLLRQPDQAGRDEQRVVVARRWPTPGSGSRTLCGSRTPKPGPRGRCSPATTRPSLRHCPRQ